MPADPVPLLSAAPAYPAISRVSPDADGGALVRAAPLFAAIMVFAWAAATIATSTAQWGDHFEQFVWAHGVQWGYYKHPPLPTWLLAGVIGIFGPAPFWADALAVACLVGTAWFTYAAARLLFDTPTAALAILLLGLLHAFSARATLFNHNTVMLLMVSATAWCVLKAVSARRNELVWWVCGGIAAALAVLAKYQAAVPLAGIALSALWSGDLARPSARRGAIVATCVAVLLLVPHLVWLVHDGSTAVAYATQHGRIAPWSSRPSNIVGFVAQQLRFLIGPLLLFVILAVVSGPRGAVASGDPARIRAWLVGLVVFPLAATLLIGSLIGQLQNHWGYQALQFASLWLARRLRPLAPASGTSWFAAALGAHAVLLVVGLTVTTNGDARRMDRHFPAQELADAVRRDWQDGTLCPLALVVGPTFEAGIVSVYNGGTAKVLEDNDFRKSPWIDSHDPERLGAVYLADDPARLPRHGVSMIDSMQLGTAVDGASGRIYWAIAPPKSCAAPDVH